MDLLLLSNFISYLCSMLTIQSGASSSSSSSPSDSSWRRHLPSEDLIGGDDDVLGNVESMTGLDCVCRSTVVDLRLFKGSVFEGLEDILVLPRHTEWDRRLNTCLSHGISAVRGRIMK